MAYGREEFACTSPRLLPAAVLALLLGACATSAPDAGPLPFYRCEYGIEFTAKFSGDAVTLNSSQGYDVLFKADKHVNNPKNPNEYGNVRMSAEFNLGLLQREAILRYPSLPLISRCVKD